MAKCGECDKTIKRFEQMKHNLVKSITFVLQDLYTLREEFEEYSENEYEKATDCFKRSINQNPDDVSRALLEIEKYAQGIQNELLVFDLLHSDTIILNPRSYSIHKVISGVAKPLFSIFNEKNIFIKISNSDKIVRFDYATARVMLDHIFDNALKYCKSNSVIHINFKDLQDGKYSAEFNMTSIEVKSTEIDLIFNEGYSGEQAISIGENGKGIGMHVIKKLSELNGIEVIFAPGVHQSVEYLNENNVRYSKNKIEMIFSSL